MPRLIPPLTWFLFTLCLLKTGHGGEQERSVPPAHTFSIVARDPVTGELGVAVQSKIVAVGAVVPFARADVGAVATQARANVSYGPIALDLLRQDLTAAEILELFRTNDPLAAHRQVAILPATGPPAVFTGEACAPVTGQQTGEDYAVQGNLLAGDAVLPAMAKAFETSEGFLADRLIAALRAGQAAGGDRRGRQSAALLVVRNGWGYDGSDDRLRDLRVDEPPEPIEELARVLEAHRKLFPRPPEPMP